MLLAFGRMRVLFAHEYYSKYEYNEIDSLLPILLLVYYRVFFSFTFLARLPYFDL